MLSTTWGVALLNLFCLLTRVWRATFIFYEQQVKDVLQYFRNRFDTSVRYVPLFAVNPLGSRNRRRHSY